MAAGIVYLDVDDEITSAAARIRSSTSTKVALVVPYGSRIATSRMNFRLLSREAVVSNRRLSIVAGDAASRSLAASAGLPVYATVGEYEAAIGEGASPAGADRTSGAAAVSAAAGAEVAQADDDEPEPATSLAESATVAAIGGAGAAAARHGRNRAATTPAGPETTPPSEDTTRMAVPAASAAATPAVSAPVAAPTRPARGGSPAGAAGAADEPRRSARGPLLVIAALVGLATIVVAVGAYLLLPSATIALTPKREPISVNLTVLADPEASVVDASTSTIPAMRVDVPVQVSQTFTTTGVKVEQSAATGSVVFTNYDPTASNTIVRGSIVSTEGGIKFRTLASVTVPRASFTPPSTTVPSTRSVSIEAVNPGTDGNVPPNAIRVVPANESSLFLQVNNPQATTGGTHTESPQVSKAEVDKAVATLQTQLESQFRDSVAAGEGAPTGSTVFPATANLGPSTPSPDPKSLVGQAVESYDLSLSASGTVIAVDPTPVRQVAESQLMDLVGSDHRLVDGSTQVDVGEGTVAEDGSVSFPAQATAERVLIVDPSQLRALVKGKTQAEAIAALAPYGSATVSLWPDWVTTVTGVDGRLDLRVDDSTSAGPGASAEPSASVRATGRPTLRPSGTTRPTGSGRASGSGPQAASGDTGSAAP